MSLGSKEGPKQTTTQVNQLSPHVLQAQQSLLNAATNILGPFLQTPNYSVAGLSPDQTLASDLANQLAYYTSTNLGKTPNVLDLLGSATAGKANAAQLKPGDIAPMMNPYIDLALNPTLERLKRQQAEVQAGIGADAAAAHMFGGSREAVRRSQADRNYRDTVAQTSGQMLVDAFNKAAGLAGDNTNRKQQTNLTNAQLETQTALANLQAKLGGLGLQNQMANNAVSNQLQAANLLSGLGGQQQQTMQNAINVPFDALTRLMNITSAMQGGGTTTTTGSSQAPLDIASILLGGAGILGRAGTGSILGRLLRF